MQAYIRQLNHQASQSQAPRDLDIDQHAIEAPTPAEVAIYNEDDLSHLLYVNIGHAHVVTPARDNKAALDHHLQHRDYSTLLEHPSGTHTPLSETNESAILSDCELEEDDDDLVLPPSPIRPRGGSIDSENIEFPVFLGRQSDSPPPAALKWAPVPEPQATVAESRKTESIKHVRIIAPQEHVSNIEGPLMSWWPAPLELMEHEWIEMKREPHENMVSEAHHVSYIGGPMMSWWPASPDMMQYEWNERFYE